MSKIYLPTAEQMDETIQNLANIAGALGTRIDTSSWEGVQKAVRSGLAPQLFPIGTQLVVSHSEYGDMLYDVVAHDYFKSKRDDTAHTMTLQSHDLLPKFQIDSKEAFFYADSQIPAGPYTIILNNDYGSWSAGSYHFILTKALPLGGQLFLDGSTSQNLTDLYVKSYANRTSTTEIEAVRISAGSMGIVLGTFGVELNAFRRCAYGSNNYKESAIRQFLNSSADAGNVWTPQTKFDRPPNWGITKDGFMKGLDAELKSVIGEVVIPCIANDNYESSDSTTTKGNKYTITDMICVASGKEITGTSENAKDESVIFPYYIGAVSTDLIKYNNDSATEWITRSPSTTGPNGVQVIDNTGNTASMGVSDAHGIAPVFTIV